MKRIYDLLLQQHHKDNRQMAFVSGPRQVGKTTSCRHAFADTVYFNWDNLNDKMLISKGPDAIAQKLGLAELRAQKPHVVFDEIHKYSKWKNFLKGFFDSYGEKVHITVTGSAKLNVYKRGGDSLMGRYFPYRMHPLSISEFAKPVLYNSETHDPVKISKTQFNDLLVYGGFPEPLLKANASFANRWKKLREDQLLKEDVRDLTKITELGQMHILAELIKNRAGQLVNYSSLAQDVGVSVNTIRHWVSCLETFYFCFEVRPWHKNIVKSLQKQPKIFLWDWSIVKDQGSKHENFVASHLLKYVNWLTDTGVGEYGLHYLRDKQHREVDFVVTRNDEPWFIVEVKSSSNKSVSESLYYYQKQTKVKHAFQVVFDMEFVDSDCFKNTQPVIVPVKTLLSQLI